MEGKHVIGEAKILMNALQPGLVLDEDIVESATNTLIALIEMAIEKTVKEE
ncbi:hypothetical protein M9194_19820 [Vibrio sp. S4M6]|uniref:hypothetical protein n=1 Tax=Vibrio sinus TaxID=2946865 RepID=UPI002029CA97|nr:hypothetical protein [Vibrio sinus]MCL9783677.1 hypothetical protein [Vibrio sinus]